MFAEVLLPVPIQGTFTYNVPESIADTVKIGHRVIVPFGKKKFYTGIVSALTPIAPQDYEVKDIFSGIDTTPIVRHPQLKFWQWLADYYLCTPGEVFKAAVPTGLKIESETFISLATDFEEDPDNRLTERETIVLETIMSSDKKVTVETLKKKTGFNNISPVINSLLEKEAVIISENLVERYHSRKITYVKLSQPY